MPAPHSKSRLTLLLYSWAYRYIVPYLPADLQAIAANPPDLTKPETIVTLFKAIAPYTQVLLVIIACYVVWSVVTGFFVYLYRIARFCLRIGPVIAIIAWIMAASGQGGIDVLFEALKQYAGLAPAAGQPERVQRPREWTYDTRSRRGSSSDSSHYDTRRRSKKAPPPAEDPLAAILGDGLGATVQGYVKQAVARAAGLDWLVGTPDTTTVKKEKKRTTRR